MKAGWRANALLAAILALAALLRFWGLRWGLPNSLHAYSYHPDEFLTVGAAAMALSSALPYFYNYPSLYVYLAALAIAVGTGYGLTGPAAPYLCARAVTALLGIGAVWVIYWAANRLWQPCHSDQSGPRHSGLSEQSPEPPTSSKMTGILAALVLCVAPLHVQHSHFATVDVPATLFVAVCLGFAGLVLQRGLLRDNMLCGAMAGLAAGTKYNAGLVVLALIAAHVFRDLSGAQIPASPAPLALSGRRPYRRAAKLLAGIGCAIAAFVISTPGVIFQWSAFRHGFLYEIVHSRVGHGLTFVHTGNGFLFTFTSSLWCGLGPALAILFVVCAGYGLARLDRRALIILAFALPYYALISLSEVRFARYGLPLFPAAALLIAWGATDLWKRLPESIRWVWAGVLTAAVAGTLLYAVALDRLFVQPTPQDRAARWIFGNIPRGSTIGVIEAPWFYSPPYSRSIGLGTLRQREQASWSAPYRIEVYSSHEYLGALVSRSGPRWIVTSDYEIGDVLRIGMLDASQILMKPLPWTNDYLRRRLILDTIESRYAVRRVFADRFGVLGISFGSTQSLPHDMRYPAPTIWIYELKERPAHPPRPHASESKERTP